MDATNNTPYSTKPVKKQWKEPEIFLISYNDVETKHLPYIKESTGHFGKGTKAGTFYHGPATKSLTGTVGGGAKHNSLIS